MEASCSTKTSCQAQFPLCGEFDLTREVELIKHDKHGRKKTAPKEVQKVQKPFSSSFILEQRVSTDRHHQAKQKHKSLSFRVSQNISNENQSVRKNISDKDLLTSCWLMKVDIASR